ncbi:hypothetical protein EON79_11645 [bacterium]|nr:MAG: hypothetical protein EON79_11645 [bacterium]
MEREAAVIGMKKVLLPMLLATGLVVAGCNGEAGASAAEEAAFKNPNKSAATPPPADAMKPPAGFKSSLGGETKGPGPSGG